MREQLLTEASIDRRFQGTTDRNFHSLWKKILGTLYLLSRMEACHHQLKTSYEALAQGVYRNTIEQLSDRNTYRAIYTVNLGETSLCAPLLPEKIEI